MTTTGFTIRFLDSPGPLRVVARTGDAHEAAIQDGDDLGRAQAAERLSRLLGGFRVDQLSDSADDATMALLDIDIDELAALDISSTIETDLLTADLMPNRFRVAADGSANGPSAEELGIVNGSKTVGDPNVIVPYAAAHRVTTGGTLVLNNIGTRVVGPVRSFANDLTRVSHCQVQLNAYISERDAQGFGRHWDDHDVLILQTTGRKQWDIFAPAALSPVIGYVNGKSFGEPIFSTVLEPGAGLYIPRGWGHQVKGFDHELSIHVTCGMRRFSGLDVLRGAASTAERGAVPAWTDGTLQVDAFSQLAMEPALIENVYALRRNRHFHPEVGPITLWHGINERFHGWSFTAPAVNGHAFFDLPDAESSEGIGVVSDNIAFALARAWVEPYVRLVGGAQLTLDDIASMVDGADVDAAQTWVTALAMRSIVVPHPPLTHAAHAEAGIQ